MYQQIMSKTCINFNIIYPIIIGKVKSFTTSLKIRIMHLRNKKYYISQSNKFQFLTKFTYINSLFNSSRQCVFTMPNFPTEIPNLSFSNAYHHSYTYGNEIIPMGGVQDAFDNGEIQMLSAWFQIKGWLHEMKKRKGREEPSRLGEG